MADETPVQRICLFGGTFDPIHIAHLKIANEALRAFSLTKVYFVPAAHPPHKSIASITPYEERVHMCEIACAPYPPFEVAHIEGGPETSYTIDTLRKVRAELPPGSQLFFLIGADAFDEVTTWKDWREVVTLTEFIVVPRPGRTYAVPEGATVHPLEGIEMPVSSSELRKRLAAGDDTAEVPAQVREYIEQRGLYRDNNSPTEAAFTA